MHCYVQTRISTPCLSARTSYRVSRTNTVRTGVDLDGFWWGYFTTLRPLENSHPCLSELPLSRPTLEAGTTVVEGHGWSQTPARRQFTSMLMS
jgi:hypothetical protein